MVLRDTIKKLKNMKNYMKRRPPKAIMVLFGLLAIAAFTVAVMLLWNWLMPLIFGLTTITFLQALGILALSKILFGGFRRPTRPLGNSHSAMHKEEFMKRFAERRPDHHPHTSCHEEHKTEMDHEKE